MSAEEEDHYKKILWRSDIKGPRLGDSGAKYIQLLERKYKSLPFRRQWLHQGYPVLGQFAEKSQEKMNLILGNKDLNLLVVQAQHLRLSGEELKVHVHNKFLDATSDDLLKASQVAARCDATGELCYYLDAMYTAKKSK